MTRFEMEINGHLGAFWKQNAEKEAQEAAKYAAENANVDENGAISWKSNGRYLPDDYCEKLKYVGFPFSREATRSAREVQVAAELAEYRRNYQGPTPNKLEDMRRAFGEGATVVNVITGTTIHL